MIPDVTVLVPVLGRPHRARLVAQSVADTSDAAVLFLATAGDWAELDACHDAYDIDNNATIVVPFDHGPGDYARKINYAVLINQSPWLFQGADDLTFHPGWLDAALAAAERTGALVVGTQDRSNPRVIRRQHSTHNLVAREWINTVGTSDQLGLMLHEGYHHNFVDDELVYTAKLRRRYVFADDAIVEHHHPLHSDTPLDATYELGLDRHKFAADRRHLRARQKMIGKYARAAAGRPDRRRPTPKGRNDPAAGPSV